MNEFTNQPADTMGSTPETDLAERLEQYFLELESNPHAKPPAGFDPQVIEAVNKMNAYYDAPEPDPAFVSALGERLSREASTLYHTNKQRRSRLLLPRWSFVGIGAALVIALGAFAFFATRPAPASADQVLDKAASVANNLAATGVSSFELESVSDNPILGDPQQPIAGISHTVTNMAYAGPTVWRVQNTTQALGDTTQMLNVSDGATLWTFDAYNNVVTADVATPNGLPLPNVASLEVLKTDWSNCFTPKVVGEEQVAGRAAYKVDLGENKCQSASLFMFEGSRTLWVDKETFFILRDEFVGKDGKQNLGSYRVTSVRYNLDIPKDTFQYSPPPGANIRDNRPKPAPSPQQFRDQLSDLAQRVEYPVFVPSTLPSGLVPRVPQFDSVENSIKLEYVPQDEASTNTMADSHGVVILELRATYETIRNWTDGSERVDINGNQGWVRRGNFDSQLNTGSNSAVMLVRDGTLLSISSFRIPTDQLLEIARALEPVAGSHAPLPNPTAPTLAEIRAQSAFPFFVPTYVPEGLTPEPPTSNQVQYHTADGNVALIVANAEIGKGGMEAEPRFAGKTIKLGNGIEAHELGFEPQIIILWWHQDNGYISLEGHGLARAEMLKIADSMSSTAELGETQAPPARPTPTAVPAPPFMVLYPTELPEKMTVTEINVPTPDGQGAGIEIHFDPHPDSAPHDTMTLTEFPQKFAEDLSADDQAVQQTIGGHEVTIIKRGKGCVMYAWIQDGVALRLTNPYDPPGEPGQVRYTCDQMEQVVASVK